MLGLVVIRDGLTKIELQNKFVANKDKLSIRGGPNEPYMIFQKSKYGQIKI